MLFCTSLVAQVGAGEQASLSPCRLQLTNTKVRSAEGCRVPTGRGHLLKWLSGFMLGTLAQRQTTICELNFATPILAVKMNRKRLVVVLEENIHIYDISNMKSLYVIDTPPNPKGEALADMGSSAGHGAHVL